MRLLGPAASASALVQARGLEQARGWILHPSAGSDEQRGAGVLACVVSMMPAMPQALVRPERVTLAGSSTPAASRSSTLSSICTTGRRVNQGPRRCVHAALTRPPFALAAVIRTSAHIQQPCMLPQPNRCVHQWVHVHSH